MKDSLCCEAVPIITACESVPQLTIQQKLPFAADMADIGIGGPIYLLAPGKGIKNHLAAAVIFVAQGAYLGVRFAASSKLTLWGEIGTGISFAQIGFGIKIL